MFALNAGSDLDYILEQTLETSGLIRSAPSLYLIAASPESCLASDIWRQLDDIKAAGTQLKVIFGHLEWSKNNRAAIRAYLEVFGKEKALSNVRNISAWKMRHLNEQLLVDGAANLMGQSIFQKRGTSLRDFLVTDLRPGGATLMATAFENVFSKATPLIELDHWKPANEPVQLTSEHDSLPADQLPA